MDKEANPFISAKREPYKALRDTLTNAMYAPFRLWRKHGARGKEQGNENPRLRAAGSMLHANSIWALKDVSFEVKQGEVVSIVGGGHHLPGAGDLRRGVVKNIDQKLLDKIVRHPQRRLSWVLRWLYAQHLGLEKEPYEDQTKVRL